MIIRHAAWFAALLFVALLVSTGHASGGKGKTKGLQVSKILKKSDAKVDGGEAAFPYMDPGLNAGDDRTLAPYFFEAGGDPGLDRLPLKETSATVRIAGVIAGVEVRQVYANDGQEPIEAVYVFPASTRAAVHGLTMKIGKRTVEAKIEKRKEAKEIYEKAKAEGKKAALLEQQRPNVLTMNVANIMPGDRVEVMLRYSELLVHEKGVYEFVYPSCVGPRYAGGADPVEDLWIETPYQHEGEAEPYGFDLSVELETGVPVEDIESPSHGIDVKRQGPDRAEVTLAHEGGGNRDFILRYRLAGEAIEGDVMLYEHGDESFFLLMVQPPRKVPEDIVLPREYIFLLDVSGSMYGFPLDTAKGLMKGLLKELGAGDYFNVVTFAGSSKTMSEKSLAATAENTDKAVSWINGIYGGGGTELMEGLKRAYGVPPVEGKKLARSVVVVTDGYVGVESKAFAYIRDHLSEANLFAFGIGTSVNRCLIEGMARAGFGEPFVVTDEKKAGEEAGRFRQYVQRPLLTDIDVEFDGFKAYDQAPVKVPDLMAERPLVLFGKYKGKAAGSIKVKGRTADGAFERIIKVDAGAVSKTSEPIRRLWARKWVDLLGDQLHMLPGSTELRKAVTKLGLRYSLLTAFTSFVAVDKVESKGGDKLKTVKQPLPLPAGVSDYALPSKAGKIMSGTGYGYGTGSLSGSAAVAYPLQLKASASVSGSISKTDIFKKIKAALVEGKLLEQLKTECACESLKLTLTVAFQADGTFKSLKVEVEDGEGVCACPDAFLKLIKKSLEKTLSTFTYPGTGALVIKYPLVLSP